MDLIVKRTLAFVVDMAISSMLFMFMGNFMPLLIDIGNFQIGNFEFLVKFSFIFVFYLVYLFAFDVLRDGTTLGKSIFGVVTLASNDNEKLSKGELLKRSVYKTISIIVLPISALFFYFRNNFTLQDMMCRTKTLERSMA